MNNQDTAMIAHLKKSLRALHMALAVAEKSEYGHMVTDPIRAAIREIHVSLSVVSDQV
jgi:hypothetical protein